MTKLGATDIAAFDLEQMFQSLQLELDAHRPRDGEASKDSARQLVPVTLLTGFLGAGKSTLLAGVLCDPPDGVVVRALVNDVGELPLDPSLVVDGADLEVELSNGCGCCSSSDDLGEALSRLAASGADVVIFEASGLADPFALAQLVEGNPDVDLDRVVVAVDALSLQEVLDDVRLSPVLRRQLDAAEAVVMTGADRLEGTRLDAALAQLSELVPGRTIVASEPERLATAALLPGSVRGAALPTDGDAPGHPMVTLTVEQTAPVSLVELEQTMADLPPTLVRCKGLLSTHDQGAVAVQATPAGWDVDPIDDDRPAMVTIVGTEAADVAAVAVALGCP